MGIYLNPGNELFKRAVNSKIYVDKSMLISETNKVLDTEQLYVAVSRPRRFGKSMAANMLVAYYDKSCDSHDLFDKLKIAQNDSYETNMNHFNVIKLNMQDFLSDSIDIDGMIGTLQEKVLRELRIEFEIAKEGTNLVDALQLIYAYNREKFIIVIDEWDCVLREKSEDEEGHRKYLDFLRYLLKDKPYVSLVYMTGILPIKKYGSHSALNIFSEYSMINPGNYAEYVGFTDNEIQEYCGTFGVDPSKMKEWYNGYYLKNVGAIYNPRAAVSALTSNVFQSYWTRTETYEALKIYIETNMNGLKDSIIKMLAGEHEAVNPEKFQNDMTTFKTKDDVLTLLVHLGYLAYDEAESKVYIPNYEIRCEFKNAVEGADWSEVVEALQQSESLLQATWNYDMNRVSTMVDGIHDKFTSILKYNDENSMACVLALAYYNAINYYTRVQELPTGKGFADIAFIPKKNIDKPALIIELKYDKSVKTAIDQIKERHYVEGLKEYQGNMLLVGINYDKETKKHECMIEKFENMLS